MNKIYDINVLVSKYSRQMMIPFFGIEGQKKLFDSTIGVIGAGGIGSTVLLYLAGAGIGRLIIIDDDKVDESNLHRQIIHSMDSINLPKVFSAKQKILTLNPTIDVTIIQERLTSENAIEIFKDCDIIIDCTDNAESRYIINDACFILNKCWITGSAIGLEGQITVLTPGRNANPCFRCIYPSISHDDCNRTCDIIGVLGPVPGIIGSLQAIEAIKYLLTNKLQNNDTFQCLVGKQLFYDGFTGEFHTFQLPKKNPNCIVCSKPSTSYEMLESKQNIDFMKKESTVGYDIPVLDEYYNISCQDYFRNIISHKVRHILLDVRSNLQFNMINMREFYTNYQSKVVIDMSTFEYLNLPYNKVLATEEKELESIIKYECDIYVLCRRGNDSIRVTHKLLNLFNSCGICVYNIQGGLSSWKVEVDELFPAY